jgi:DNA replication protein DnaC
MEILEAYDLTGSLRGAAVLVGCDHKTVGRLVAAREAEGGGLPVRARRRPVVDAFACPPADRDRDRAPDQSPRGALAAGLDPQLGGIRPMTVKPPAPPPLPDELDRLLRRLRLPYVRRAAPDVIATATAQRWEHAEVLRVLLTEEAAGRDKATIGMRRRASGLPAGKTFEAWEVAASVIPKPTQQALRTLEWIDRAEVLCICGPSGTGKSHFIEALGHLAIDNGKTVAWHTLETLAALFRRHRADDSINKAVTKLIRSDLILVDDIGLLPVSTDAADALFRVVDAAYEKRSIAISSNIHPSGFDELMPKTMATATVDRLLHHAHVIITDGQDSYRLAQATAGKGVRPLT